MISAILSRLVILVFGTLYPAYASYKAVRTKNLKEYVKWMMYWIVFALFTCIETFTDVFLSWFPFYYEVKIVLVIWLLSPATKGSSILYRKFVHPALCRREQEIDEYIAKAKDQGYHTVLNLGTKGVNYATTVIMQTAIKGGGGLVQQIRKSYSLSDLTECEPHDERSHDEADDVMTEPRLIRRTTKGAYVTRRSASESNSRSPMYFPEVDVDVRQRPRSDEPDFNHIKSTEDISSGYSSADNSASLTRTASLGASRARPRSSRTTLTAIKRPQPAEEGEVIIKEIQDEDGFDYANMPALVPPSPIYLSHSDPPFLYQYVGDQVKIIQVLGNYPLHNDCFNKNAHLDGADKQTPLSEVTERTATIKKTEIETNDIMPTTELSAKDDSKTINKLKEITDFIDATDMTNDINTKHTASVDGNNKVTEENTVNIVDTKVETENDDKVDEDDSMKDYDSADDEASFGTPDNSPKSKKKHPKGKYGKSKAPLPPKADNIEVDGDRNKIDINIINDSASHESLVDIVNKLPNTPIKESGHIKGLQVINPISEIKRRHKSKSPGRIPKGNSSSITKLLQLPSKFAFWNKNEDKSKSDISTSSGDHSRRSSYVEQVVIDEFQSCADLTSLIPNVCDESPANYVNILESEAVDEDNSFTDAIDLEKETTSNEIIEKSDALQRLIEAKLESHPEYKIVSLHEEMPTSSKSTDV